VDQRGIAPIWGADRRVRTRWVVLRKLRRVYIDIGTAFSKKGTASKKASRRCR
jgi:hypothetical protein